MDFALPALTVFVLALPGFTFRLAYLRGFRGLPVVQRPFVEEVAWGLVWAIVLHAVWLWAGALLTTYAVDFVAVGRLLSSEYGEKGAHLAETVGAVFAHPAATLFYFGSLMVVSFVAGATSHSLVNRTGLRKFWLLEFRDDWHRVLIPDGRFVSDADPSRTYDKVFAEITAVVPTDQEDYLYRGVLGLESFRFDSNGDLDYFVLTTPARRKLSDSKAPFYVIESDRFVLRYRDVKNLNVRYKALQEEPEPPAGAQPDGALPVESEGPHAKAPPILP